MAKERSSRTLGGLAGVGSGRIGASSLLAKLTSPTMGKRPLSLKGPNGAMGIAALLNTEAKALSPANARSPAVHRDGASGAISVSIPSSVSAAACSTGPDGPPAAAASVAVGSGASAGASADSLRATLQSLSPASPQHHLRSPPRVATVETPE